MGYNTERTYERIFKPLSLYSSYRPFFLEKYHESVSVYKTNKLSLEQLHD